MPPHGAWEGRRGGGTGNNERAQQQLHAQARAVDTGNGDCMHVSGQYQRAQQPNGHMRPLLERAVCQQVTHELPDQIASPTPDPKPQSARACLAEAGLAAVDPDNADLQRCRNTLTALCISADDGACQAKLALVGERERLLLITKRANCRRRRQSMNKRAGRRLQ